MHNETTAPPYSLRAECALLGAILLDTRVIDGLGDRLSAEDFYSPAARTIFVASRELHNSGTPANAETVAHRLRERRQLDDLIIADRRGVTLIASLTDAVPSSVAWEYHAKIITDLATRRRLIDLGAEWQVRARNLSTDVASLLDGAETAIMALRRNQSSKAVRIGDAAREAIELLEKTANSGSHVVGIGSGLIGLDRVTGGFCDGDLWLLAGRPSMGKSALGVQIAARCAIHTKPAVVFSLEMPRVALARRLMAAEAAVDQTKIRSAFLSADETDRVLTAASQMQSWPLYVDDSGSLSIGELRARTRRLVTEHQVGLVVVDYLQMMCAPEARTEEQKIAAISAGLKGLAKDLNIPIIALSQLNRQVENRADKRPILSDLRGSGSQEQDADGVVFVHRAACDDANADPGDAFLIVAKNRNGAVGTLRCRFMREWTRFENAAESAS